MQTNTPRTETERLGSNIKNQSDSDKEWPWSAIDRGWDFARILERELASVTAERDALRAKLDMGTPCLFEDGKRKDIQEVAAERDALLAEKANPETTWDDTVEINKLRAEFSASQQETRRLREALDAIMESAKVAYCATTDPMMTDALVGIGKRCKDAIEND